MRACPYAYALRTPSDGPPSKCIEHPGVADVLLPIAPVDLTTAVAARQSPVLFPPVKILDQTLLRGPHSRQGHERHGQVVRRPS